ncbi:6-bladed beta-propeller [Rhodohalobacter halophilus]|uniref:6-bladed beta-propeller n=1 Tax=Rhodohalobacter halophilus TaxID=1812810 RepID=UPI00083FBEA5|nr:6-bladed beta-propeller [Rhodohalobacter halophilus]
MLAFFIMYYRLFILLSLILFISCENNTSKIIHPTEANLFNQEEISFSISQDTSSNNIELRQIAHDIRKAELSMELGSGDNILGNIIDASFNNNLIYLLDEQKMNVSVYNVDGEYISSTARKGRGPGELISPEAIIAFENYLFILNNHYDVQIYKSNSTEYEPYDQLNLRIRPDDICLNKGKLIVNTLPISDESSNLQESKNISVFEIEDFETETYKFGSMYTSDSWFAKMHMSMGGIGCSPKSNTVIQYFRNIGQLTGYHTNGENKWKSKFEDFNHLQLVEQAGVLGPDRNNPQNDFDSIENVAYINDKHFIVQIFNRELVDDRYKTIIKTYVLDFDSGEGVFVSSDIPKIIGVNYSERIYLAYNPDKPTVSTFRF